MDESRPTHPTPPLSDEPVKYTGHDFAELMTGELARVQAISLLLRSHGIDARAMEAGGWSIGGPSETATVLVPRQMVDEARSHIKEALIERSGVEWDAKGDKPSPRCPTCGYSLEGLGSVGTCPECGAWFIVPEEEPVVSSTLRAKRSKNRPIALALALVIIVLIVVAKLPAFW